MTVIVRIIVRFVSAMIMLFGVYLILHGHLSPGGGFAGGVILTSAFVLLTLAYGKKVSLGKISLTAASVIESLGALMFLSIALMGLLGGFFFMNLLPKGRPFELLSAGIIPLCNIAIGLKVGGALFLVFVVLSAMRVRAKRGK
jgi:multicomponent Na+:H+ antiporter subunit B